MGKSSALKWRRTKTPAMQEEEMVAGRKEVNLNCPWMTQMMRLKNWKINAPAASLALRPLRTLGLHMRI
jgi:hypothetical protein